METIVKKKIIDNILSKVPPHLNPVDFLYDILSLSKESVYRRLKGEVSFSLEDMIKIAEEIPISLDEIVLTSQNTEPAPQPIIFQSRSDRAFEPQKTFTELLFAYVQNIEKISKARNVEIMIAANRLMILTAAFYKHLLKFYYYKWVHQTQQKPLDFSLSDTILSDDIVALQEEIRAYAHRGNHTYILDHYFLRNTIKEIHYYYIRDLISEKEMLLLQADLYKLIDTIEHAMKQDADTDHFANHIYISTTQIESSGLYCRYDDKATINLWISYGINIQSDNSRICGTYYSWLNSLKKYSSLVSRCNEALQTQFINRQRIYIENITDKDYFYE